MRRLPWSTAALSGLLLLAGGIGAGAETPSELPWPQNFVAEQNEPASFGFIATTTGLITISIESTSGPLLVSLAGPSGQPIQREGAGPFKLEYNITPQDLQRGVIWGVTISVKPGQPPAKGSIVISHPVADANRASAEIQVIRGRMQAKLQAARSSTHPPNARAAEINAQVAAEKQRRADMQAQRTQELLKSIGAASAVRSRAIAPMTTVKSGVLVKPPTTVQQLVPPPPPPPPLVPAVASLSVTQGQPGDPVLLTGSNFGSGGAVHFIIASGMDVAATQIDYWSDGQILAHVPSAVGVQSFAGAVYVAVSGATHNSNLVAFQFNPELTTVTLMVPDDLSDVQYAQPVTVMTGPGAGFYGSGPIQGGSPCCNIDHWDSAWSWCCGHKGNDLFYINTSLQPGWTVVSAYTNDNSGDGCGTGVGNGGAYVVDSRPGTASMYINVHWWETECGDALYTPYLVVQGPVGTYW